MISGVVPSSGICRRSRVVKISARNQLAGIVKAVTEGAVMAEVSSR